MVTPSVAASNTIRWSEGVNGLNTICSLTVSSVIISSNVFSSGQPFIAQIGPPMEMSIFRPRRVFQSSWPPAVAIARSRSSSLMGQVLTEEGFGTGLSFGEGHCKQASAVRPRHRFRRPARRRHGSRSPAGDRASAGTSPLARGTSPRVAAAGRAHPLGNPRPAVNDEVVVEAVCLPLGLDREGDAGIVAYIPHLLVLRKVATDDLVAVQAYPDRGDLGGAVRIEGDKVRQPWLLEDPPGSFRVRLRWATAA